MITLEKEFVSGVGGYSQAPGPLKYVQIDRTNGLPHNFAVYQRFYADGSPKDFEVFRIKIVPKGIQKFPGGASREILDDTERYAHTSEFGFTAWSYTNLGAAVWKFHKLASGNYIDLTEQRDEVDKPETVTNETPVIAPVKSGRGRPRVAPVELNLPDSIFSVKELAAQNNVEYITAHVFIKANLGTRIKFNGKERRALKGPETQLYAKI